MKQVFLAFIANKQLYACSLGMGTLLSAVFSFFVKNTPEYLFGINSILWLIALVINIFDIHTGIKADSKRQKDDGKDFIFKSGKGWRAFEKIFVFTMIIWFIYTMELEAVRLHANVVITSLLMWIKFIMLIYVVLIELQSIGENEETRFGEKSKVFILLDKIIVLVNEGIFSNLKRLLRVEDKTEDKTE